MTSILFLALESLCLEQIIRSNDSSASDSDEQLDKSLGKMKHNDFTVMNKLNVIEIMSPVKTRSGNQYLDYRCHYSMTRTEKFRSCHQ